MTLESKSDITNAAEPAREEELLASKVTHTPVRKTHRKLKVVLMAVLAVIVAGAIGFGVYVGDYYHADDTALAAMEPTDTVAVQRLQDGDIVFVPGDPRAGIVFYPGGNHAQFGSYGSQDGDGEASLSPEEQRALTADEVADVFL